MEALEHLAQNIINLRKKQEISQEDFAAACHVSTRYLSAIETASANPSFKVLERIANAFGITLEQLMHFSDGKDSLY